jgi:hypothetical protein
LRPHGREYDAVRAFFEKVERASLEDVRALEEGGRVGGKDYCLQTLEFLRKEVGKLKKERRERRERIVRKLPDRNRSL